MAEKKFYNTFSFTGEVVVPKEQAKLYDVKTWDSGWQTHKLNISIKEGQANSEFLDLSALYTPLENNKVYALSKNGGRLEIPFADRNKQSVIDAVADFNKFVVDLECDQEVKSERIKTEFRLRAIERKDELTDDDKNKVMECKAKIKELSENKHEFISEYDYINFIKQSLPIFKGHKVRATGNVQTEESKGKYYTKYFPKRIEIVSNEEVSELLADYDIYFDKNAIDESALKDTKKIYVNAYIMNYDRKAKADRYYPKQFIFNATAIDFNNEQHMAYLNMLKGLFEVKGKTYHHLVWQTKIYKGAEVVEFDESMLTQKQKELIAFGLKTLDDFKPKGNVYGNRVSEVRLFSPNLIDEFAEGAMDTGLKEKDFLELVALDTQDVKADDVKETSKVVETPKNNDMQDQLKALFK